jgi:hypothetical protein
MIYDSGINIEGKNVDEISEELREVALQLKPRPR